MLTAISYLIPFVCTAGMLMVIGNIAGGSSVEDFTKQLAFPDFLTTIGGTALGFLPIVISTGISYSIADKAGIAPGIILGLLCKDAGFGFLGASQRLSGRISDCLSVKSYESTKMGCRIVASVNSSLIGSLAVGLVMKYVIGIPINALTNAITDLLVNMQNNAGMIIPFGILVGILSAVDYGGPINKVVFVFACGVMAEGIGGPIAILMQASMIAPFGLTIGYFLSKIMKKDIFLRKK